MAPVLPHPIGRDGKSRSRFLSNWVLKQAERGRKAADRQKSAENRLDVRAVSTGVAVRSLEMEAAGNPSSSGGMFQA